MSLAFNERKEVTLQSNSNTTSITNGKDLLILYVKQPMEDHKEPTSNKKAH